MTRRATHLRTLWWAEVQNWLSLLMSVSALTVTSCPLVKLWYHCGEGIFLSARLLIMINSHHGHRISRRCDAVVCHLRTECASCIGARASKFKRTTCSGCHLHSCVTGGWFFFSGWHTHVHGDNKGDKWHFTSFSQPIKVGSTIYVWEGGLRSDLTSVIHLSNRCSWGHEQDSFLPYVYHFSVVGKGREINGWSFFALTSDCWDNWVATNLVGIVCWKSRQVWMFEKSLVRVTLNINCEY